MNKENENLCTSGLQFSFKPGSSTSLCTMIQETVSYFVHGGSNVYDLLLDAIIYRIGPAIWWDIAWPSWQIYYFVSGASYQSHKIILFFPIFFQAYCQMFSLNSTLKMNKNWYGWQCLTFSKYQSYSPTPEKWLSYPYFTCIPKMSLLWPF